LYDRGRPCFMLRLLFYACVMESGSSEMECDSNETKITQQDSSPTQ
jgi:hypothetical protein